MLTGEQTETKPTNSAQPGVGRAVLIVNSRARQGQENFRLAIAELQRQGVRLVEAYSVSHPQHLRPVAERLLEQEKPDSLLVGGGDGTVSALAHLLAHRGVRLGVIPLGTANDFVRNLHIEPTLEAAIRVIRAGFTRSVDLGLAGERYFLNVASIGFGVEVAARADASLKRWIGPLAYGAAALQAANEVRPVSVRLTFLDRPHGDQFEVAEFKALQVSIANGRYYGGGMVSAPNNTISDNKLAVTVIEAMSGAELLQILPGLRDGSYVRHPRVHHYATTDVQVETGRPREINLDGEVCQRTPLRFKVAPAILQVFAPKGL